MNKRGFTLVELLAAIVILGLLMSLAVSNTFKTIERGRNKTYISDANSMISQVEYLVKSKPNELKRPTGNQCVVVFLSYFNSEDFSNPPNGGKYDEKKSFVIYKNVGSKYEYSAQLIEILKGGGYKGVDLTKGIDLSKGKGDLTLRNISYDFSIGNKIRDYINAKWSGYCQSIIYQ